MKRARNVFTWFVLIGAVVAALLILLPGLLGYDRYVIDGGSMEPTIPKGSVVYAKPAAAATLVEGDIITYSPPPEAGVDALVTHRIVARTVRPDQQGVGRIVFRTKGDANRDPDPWHFTLDDGEAGLEEAHVPYLGWVYMALAIPAVRFVLITVPALLIVVLTAVSLWREAGREAEEERRKLKVVEAGGITVLIVAAIAFATPTSLGYFSTTKASPQPIEIAPIPPVRFESASSADEISGFATVSKPAGVRQGWVLVATMGIRGYTNVDAPNGWTQIRAVDSPTRNVTLRSYYKVAGLNEPPSYTFTEFPAQETTIGIVAYSGVRSSNPIATSAGASGFTATATAPATNAAYETRRVIAVAYGTRDPITFTGATQSWQESTLLSQGAAADAPQPAGPAPVAKASQRSVEWAMQAIVLNGALAP